MEYKQHSQEIKELDEAEGVVTAFANVYNVEDSDGDISSPGSFLKTVSENFKRIRVLKDHNPQIMLGVPLKIDANDPYGLLVTTKFNMNKEVSRDAFTDIKLMLETGLNAELSIGYSVVKRNEKDRRKIDEYRLWEYSHLTSWAANELSTVQDIKSIKSHYGVIELLQKMYNLDYSDSRLTEIETILKSLTMKPSEPDTSEVEPIELLTTINSISWQ